MQVFFGGLFLIAFYIYLSYSNFKLYYTIKLEESTWKKEKKSIQIFYSAILNKILLNYFQILSLIKEIDLKSGSQTTAYFQLAYYLGNVPNYIFNFDCLLQNNFRINSFYLQIILIAFSPFLVLIFLFIFWYLKSIKKDVGIKFPWNKVMASSLILLTILQPTIVNTMTKIMSCKEINGKSYIINNYLYEWDTSENKFYVNVFALPSLIIWNIIYPLFNLVRLFSERKKLSSRTVRKKSPRNIEEIKNKRSNRKKNR